MSGSCAKSAGVIVAPTATPRIVRAPTEISPNPLSCTPSRAASKQALIGPKRKGSGRFRDEKRATPITASANVTARGLNADVSMGRFPPREVLTRIVFFCIRLDTKCKHESKIYD